VTAPELPEDLAGVQLDAEVRQDLRGLRKDVAEEVARHLVAAGTLLEADAAQALAHARYARSKASRLAVVREATGVAAYYAGEWAEAIAELRAARRMGGGPGHLAVLADAERALGRPERALEISRGPEAAGLGREEAIELVIVASGARRDLGELDAAVVALQVPELGGDVIAPWSARLRYAYADALLAAGRRDEAVQWFLRTVEIDEDELTDATDRLAELADEPHGPDDPADAQADDPTDEPSDALAEEQADQPSDAAMDEPSDAATDEPSDAATDDRADSAADDLVDAQAESPAAEPADASNDPAESPVPRDPAGGAGPDDPLPGADDERHRESATIGSADEPSR
jgi:tetratricopeptide (TPR) repeat protein